MSTRISQGHNKASSSALTAVFNSHLALVYVLAALPRSEQKDCSPKAKDCGTVPDYPLLISQVRERHWPNAQMKRLSITAQLRLTTQSVGRVAILLSLSSLNTYTQTHTPTHTHSACCPACVSLPRSWSAAKVLQDRQTNSPLILTKMAIWQW